MGFCQHHAAKMIAEFDDAWAKKLKKVQLSQQIFFQLFIKRRESIRKVIYQKKIWGHRTVKRVKSVVIDEFDKYHLLARVLFLCFKPPTVITSLAHFGYYGGRFKTRK